MGFCTCFEVMSVCYQKGLENIASRNNWINSYVLGTRSRKEKLNTWRNELGLPQIASDLIRWHDFMRKIFSKYRKSRLDIKNIRMKLRKDYPYFEDSFVPPWSSMETALQQWPPAFVIICFYQFITNLGMCSVFVWIIFLPTFNLLFNNF